MVRHQSEQGRYFKIGSMTPGDVTSKPPAYPARVLTNVNAKV